MKSASDNFFSLAALSHAQFWVTVEDIQTHLFIMLIFAFKVFAFIGLRKPHH